jgi:signal transduction histidine kinase/CheY-like chemotaxis protein
MNDLYQLKLPGISLDSQGELNIADFCDMKQFEQLMKDWAESTGLATVAVGKDGEYISGCYNFTDFCYNLTRKSPEGLRRCKECDRNGSGTYICHAGLVDFAAPITLEDGTLLGSIVGGQVLPDEPDEARFRSTARELGIDEDVYIAALGKMNIRSRSEVRASADLLANVVNYFVRASYATHRDADSLNRRARIISSLGKIYFCDYYIDLGSGLMTELDADDYVKEFTRGRDDAAGLLAESCRTFADEEYVDNFIEFTDLATLKERLSGRQNISFEFLGKRSGWCRAIFIAVDRDAGGSVSQVIYAVQRIQEEKEKELRTQQTLRESAERANAANRAKSEFLSRMSHDIRTPLNGIIGMTYLTQKMELPEAAQKNLGKISTSSKFLLSLVNDVLDMSKAETQEIVLHPEPYTFDEFRAYIDAVIRPQCEEKHQSFVFSAAPIPGYTPLVDITRLNRIYFNLLSNSVKYTPEGGTISLNLNEELLENSRIRFTLTVSDNGIGMSRQFQEHLFEPFMQENRDDNSEMRGTGLGLAIVKKTVDAMGGTISVESEKGRGSSFIVTIVSPCIKESDLNKERSLAANITAGDRKGLDGRHILLCEDHPLNQEIAKALLTEYGTIVEIADEGQAGTKRFETSAVGYYDAILMDIRMPVMDGYQAARTIRGLDRPDAKTVPIIAMTADAFSDDVQKCLDSGMNGHVAKPIVPDRLFEELNRAINK